jgi:UDP-N-acetylmuramoyl-L-alanyl-D-glutamate--2,6-diaminopimelate ligase
MSDHAASFRSLLVGIPFNGPQLEIPDVKIDGIAIDSRRVKSGDLFVCLKGGVADGHDYISQAISNGAVAVVGEEPLQHVAVPYVQLRNTREALTWIAAAFHHWPARQLTVIGVTGTDGKTTTVNLIHAILNAAGLQAGMISSVNAVVGDTVLDTGFHVTTPDAHDVQAYLARMVAAGATHVVLETTSHGWAQHRVDACEFDIGVVTNITHEHLDEHGTYENYRAAKSRLFTSLERTLPKENGNPRLAVINRDDRSYEFLRGMIRVPCLSYGQDAQADLRAVDVISRADGVRFTALGQGLRVAIATLLIGEYNVSNCLAALGATVVGLQIGPQIAAAGIASMTSVPGRMERIEMGQDFMAIVDFAHTPNALEVALRSARRLLAPVPGRGRVIAVFGSAGLRDRAKRRLMAEIAAQLADFTILTAEDPRTESLDSILEDMADGAAARGGREGESFWRIPDRGDALKFAVRLARASDVVLACGKGHEQSMCFGAVEYPWDDRTAMRSALADRLGVQGPGMPYLPTRDKPKDGWLE